MRKLLLSALLSASCAGALGHTIYLPGFRTYNSAEYQPNAVNVDQLKALKHNLKPIKIVEVSASEPGTNMHLCRASWPIYSPGKKAYEDVLADALAAELNAADLYGETDGVPVNVRLSAFDFGTFGHGSWTITATFTVAGHEPLEISHEISFPSSYAAASACQATNAQQFRALSEFLAAFYAHPRFLELAGAAPNTNQREKNDQTN